MMPLLNIKKYKEMYVNNALSEIHECLKKAEFMVSKLYLHVGHGKTGSSYIQSCLAKSKFLLDKNKICYPISESERLSASLGHISSGNGHILFKDNFYEAIRQFMSVDHESLLLSSEMLITQILHNNFGIQDKIKKIIELSGIKEIYILLITRNPLDLVSPVYQQAVKRSGWHLDIDEYLDHYVAHFERVLTFLKLMKEWNNVSVKTINYSYCKKDIITEVENWLQLGSVKLELPDVSIVNRSLTKGEVELQRSINATIGQCGALIADPLCEKLPHIPSEISTLSSSAKKTYLARIEPIVTEINALIEPTHRISSQNLTSDLTPDDEHFIFTKAQLKVIGESIGLSIANQRQEINRLHQIQEKLLTFRILKKLNEFPRIKKLIKTVFKGCLLSLNRILSLLSPALSSLKRMGRKGGSTPF